MRDNDWTKRRVAGLGFVVSGVTTALSGHHLFAAVLVLSGIVVLFVDWRIRANPKEAQLNIEFITEDLKIGSPFYNRLAGEVPCTAGFILVHNTSASVIKCHALISVNDGISKWPLQANLAYWYNYRSSHINIESGKSAKLTIAVLQNSSWDYRWEIPHWLDENLRKSFTEKFFRGEKAVTRAHVHITVVIKSDPFPGDGLLPTRSFIIEGQKIYESKA